jgi:pyridoxal phosphate enzyme (YggS family)
MNPVAENLASIKQRIETACRRSGRDPGSVKLVGVTKTVSIERIREGVAAGLAILGENYIQEALKKKELLAGLDFSWHFIGHLQSNKAKLAAASFDCIHTVDRESLALELDRQAQRLGRRIPVLIQVNVGDESTKSGVAPGALPALFKTVSAMEWIEARGLMTLPPWFEDPERVRPFLALLRKLLERLRQDARSPEDLVELSMGMSNDFEVAIEEGATLVRIGTLLFGERAR